MIDKIFEDIDVLIMDGKIKKIEKNISSTKDMIILYLKGKFLIPD